MEIRICVDVDDLERAIAFFTRGLGLEVGRRFSATWCELIGAGPPIDLLVEAEGSAANAKSNSNRSYQRHWTPLHLDFVVRDLEAAVHRAVEAGAVVERPITEKPYGRIALMSDPFGHGFDLIEFRGRGYDEIAK